MCVSRPEAFRLNDGFTFGLEKSSVSIGVSVHAVSLGVLAVW